MNYILVHDKKQFHTYQTQNKSIKSKHNHKRESQKLSLNSTKSILSRLKNLRFLILHFKWF